MKVNDVDNGAGSGVKGVNGIENVKGGEVAQEVVDGHVVVGDNHGGRLG
jgi:hypothetical protein